MNCAIGPEDLALLEQRFAAEPRCDVLEAILSYFCRRATSRDPRRLRYVVALIELDPLNFLHTSPLTSVCPDTNPEMYQKGCCLWNAQLVEKPSSPEIVVHAAQFFACSDRAKA